MDGFGLLEDNWKTHGTRRTTSSSYPTSHVSRQAAHCSFHQGMNQGSWQLVLSTQYVLSVSLGDVAAVNFSLMVHPSGARDPLCMDPKTLGAMAHGGFHRQYKVGEAKRTELLVNHSALCRAALHRNEFLDQVFWKIRMQIHATRVQAGDVMDELTGCKTDNSVITMRNDTCHVATVLGRQEGVVGTAENWIARALLKQAAVAQPMPIVALQESGPRPDRSDFSTSARNQKFHIKSPNLQMLASNIFKF